MALKYLFLGFFAGALVALRGAVVSLLPAPGMIPDPVLLLILAYAALGKGRLLVPLALLLGWVRGAAGEEPVGFFILTYLILGRSLLFVRDYFFMERVVPQLLFGFLFATLHALIHELLRTAGILAGDGALPGIYSILSCLTATAVSPLVLGFYGRAGFLRRILHP